MGKSLNVLLLFSYFVAVLMATQEFATIHHDNQVAQEMLASQVSTQAMELDVDHDENSHSNPADCNDCCVAGCSHHPAMIVPLSSAFVWNRSILGLSSRYLYQSPDLSALKRPPIA